MEASLVAASSAPMPPPEMTSSQSGQTTDEAAPFNAFLSAAINDQTGPQNEAKGIKTETSTITPYQQDMVMAAELAALSFQTVPTINPQQPVPGNSITTNPSGPIDTSTPLFLTPAELEQLPTMSTTTEQFTTVTKTFDKNHSLNLLDSNQQPAVVTKAIDKNRLLNLLDSNQQPAVVTKAIDKNRLLNLLDSNQQPAVVTKTVDKNHSLNLLDSNQQPAVVTKTVDKNHSLNLLDSNQQLAVVTKTVDKNHSLNLLDSNQQLAVESAPSSASQQVTLPSNKNEALLSQQLQAILTGTSSQDALTIRTSSHSQSASTETLNTLSSPYLPSQSELALSAVASSLTARVEGTIAEPEGANVPENTRKNIEEQFLNAKLDVLTNKDTNKSQHQETSQQENSNNQAGQQGANASLATSLANNDQTGLFTFTTAGTPATPVTPANAAPAQPALPPGVPVPSSEIVNHLVERFSSNPRLQTSKISMNLSPAELGALKIDIMVKGDTIKAHIGANSVQVQETIEKYMPKLRTILEQQGFTVEDFQVTLDGTSSEANDFFQQQFSSQHDTEPQTKFMSSNDSFNLALHSAEEILSAPNSGINLSI